MKLLLKILFALTITINFVGCSCVVGSNRFYIEHRKMDELQQNDFVLSFRNALESEGYSIKNHSDKNEISDGQGIYPIILDSEKPSFSSSSFVRICKDELKNQLFVQVVHSSCLDSDHEEDFNKECKMIHKILTQKYPDLIFYGACH